MELTRQLRVAVCMTAARYENTYCRNWIEAAMRSSGLKLNVSLGVFYGQCMQGLIENVVNAVDVIITVDGDSIFTAEHIDRLLCKLAANDDVDALAAMQVRRGMRFPLFTVGNTEEITIEIDPEKPYFVQTAHFGLTALRAEKFAGVIKPWFFAQPNRDGGWATGTGKIDDDIWFWRQWKQAGNTIAIDPGCRIGHMEEMVAYYDESMQLRHCYPSDWKEMCERDCAIAEAVGV